MKTQREVQREVRMANELRVSLQTIINNKLSHIITFLVPLQKIQEDTPYEINVYQDPTNINHLIAVRFSPGLGSLYLVVTFDIHIL